MINKIFFSVGYRWQPWLLGTFLFLLSSNLALADKSWVGGPGITGTSWSDPGNWMNGGPTSISPSSTAPGPNDVVYIHNTVTNFTIDVDQPTATCLGIDFSTYTGPMVTINAGANNSRLRVVGDANLNSASVQWDYNENFILEGTGARTFHPGGHMFQGPVIFNGPASPTYTVQAFFQSEDNVYHRTGTVDFTDGANIGGYYSEIDNGNRNLILSSFGATDFTLNNSFVTGDEASWPWNTVDNFSISMPNEKMIFAGQIARVYAFDVDFGIVEFTHSNNGGRGEAIILGENGIPRNTFDMATFMGNATLANDNDFIQVFFERGNVYRFGAGRTQFVDPGVGLISQLPGTCDFTTFESTQKCEPAIFDGFNTAAFTELAAQDIQAPATWGAGNSIDLGGNSNITFGGSPMSQEYYWQGTFSNEWGFGMNWVNAVGAQHLCPPSPIDDVFFDDTYSVPTTINVDVPVAYCRNMNWSNAGPGWVLGNMTNQVTDQLIVRGNQVMSANVGNQYLGMLQFDAFPTTLGTPPTNTIESNGFQWRNNVFFSGCDASWQLVDDFTAAGQNLANAGVLGSGVRGIVFLENGHLDLNENALNALGFDSDGFGQRSMDMSFAEIEINGEEDPNLNIYAWNVDRVDNTPGSPDRLVLDATQSMINFNADASLNRPEAEIYTLHAVTFNGTGRLHGNVDFQGPVEFMADGTIGWPDDPTLNTAFNIFRDDLILARNKVYVIEIGEEQSFTTGSVIQTQGDCSGYTQIRSSLSGTTTILTNNSGATMNLDFVVLRDLEADGPYGVNYLCDNSYLNNCIPVSGWGTTNSTPVPKDLWWIGGLTGSTSWGDPANWSTTDPNILVTVSTCIPGPATDAIFVDVGSSGINDIVEVDVCNAYVHNMRWELFSPSSSVTFRNTPQVSALYVYGSWEMCNGTGCDFNDIIIDFDADIWFYTDADPLDLIYMYPGLVFQSDLYFDGQGKTWRQRSDLVTTGEEFLIVGTHATDEFNLEVDRFLGFEDGHLDMSAGTNPDFTINGTSSNVPLRYSFESRGTFQFTHGTSKISLTNDNQPSIFAPNNLAFYDVVTTSSVSTAELWTGNTYNSFEFAGNAEIRSSNFYEVFLKLAPAKTYIINENETQTIGNNGDFFAQGSLTEPITIQSRLQGIPTNIERGTAQSMCIAYCNLTDFYNVTALTNMPGLWALARRCNNISNNFGWEFEQRSKSDPCEPDYFTYCSDMPYAMPTKGNYPGTATYTWFENGIPISTSATPTINLLPGTNEYTVDIADNNMRWREHVLIIAAECCVANSDWPQQAGVNSLPGVVETGYDVIHTSASPGPIVCGEAEFGAVFGPFVLSNPGGYVVAYDDCGDPAWLTELPEEAIPVKMATNIVGDRLFVLTESTLGLFVFEIEIASGSILWQEYLQGSNMSAGDIAVTQHDVFICGTVTGSFLTGGSVVNPAPIGATGGFVAKRNINTPAMAVTARIDSDPGGAATAQSIETEFGVQVFVGGRLTNASSVEYDPLGSDLNKVLTTGNYGYVVKIDNNAASVSLENSNYNTVQALSIDFDEGAIFAINGYTPGGRLVALEMATLTPIWSDLQPGVAWTDMDIATDWGHEGVFLSGVEIVPGPGPNNMLLRKYDLTSGVAYDLTSSTAGTSDHIAHGIGVHGAGHTIHTTGTFAQDITFGSLTTVNTTGTADEDVVTCRFLDTPPTTGQFFKTESPTGGFYGSEDFHLSLMPNPTRGELVAEVHLPAAQTVALRVVDFFGRVIVEEQHNLTTSDRLVIDLSGHASGIYHVSLSSDSGTLNQKVVLTD